MPLEGNDELLVNRSGTTYTLEQQNLMAEIQGNDLLLVNRSGATYTATGQELIDSVVPDLELIVTFVPNIPYIDEVITAVANTSGGVAPEGGYTFTYQWSISDDINGTNQVNLLGENSNTYTPTQAQSGKFLGCTIQTTDARGTIANATGRTGPIDFKPATDPPVINSVVLTQDAVNDKRFSNNSFTTTVDADNRPNQLAMEAQVVGALSLAMGTDVITTEDTDGKTPLELTLASNTNLAPGRFEVGDVVQASTSYTPRTSQINSVATSNYDVSFSTSGTVNISNLPANETFVIIAISDGYNGATGGQGGDRIDFPRGGCSGYGGDAGSLYYRQFTREEYMAEYGNNYTQSKSNNFGGIAIYNGGSPTGTVPTESRCPGQGGGSKGALPAEPGTLEALNEALAGSMVVTAGAGGSGGSYSGPTNNDKNYWGQGGQGGMGGLVVTSDVFTVPTIPSASNGSSSGDSRGGEFGQGGQGWGAGGGGGGADGDNGSANQVGGGGAGAAGMNIVVIGTGVTTITVADDEDLNKFQPGDVVQEAVTYNAEGRTVYYVNGFVNGRQFKTPTTDPEAPFEGNSGSRCVAGSPNIENGIGMVWPTPYQIGGSFYKIKLATNNTMYFVVNDDWDTPIPTDGPYPAGVTFEGNDTFDITAFVSARGNALSSVYVYSTTGVMGVNGFNNGNGWVGMSWGESYIEEITVIDSDVASNTILVDGGDWNNSNQNAVWSQQLTGDFDANYGPEYAFDGNIDTNTFTNSGSIVFDATSYGFNITSLRLRFYASETDNITIVTSAGTFPFSEGSQNQFVWLDCTGVTGTLQTITIAKSNGNTSLGAIEVNGRLLVDAVLDNQVWSEQTTSSFLSGYTAEKGFNGVLSGNNGCIGNSEFTFNFTGLTINSTLRIWGSGADGSFNVAVGGQVLTPFLDGDGWHVIDLSSVNLPADFTQMNATDTSVIIAGVEVDGKMMLDPGTRDFGANTVSTISPKRGEGTISDITNNVVTLTSFTDNCFVEGQYLLHTTPKPIKITPITEVITQVNSDSTLLTFAGNDELIEFASGDPVTMCDANGNPASALVETSKITSAVPAEPVEIGWTTNGGWNGPGSWFRVPVEDTQCGAKNEFAGGGTINFSPAITGVTKFEVLVENNYDRSGTLSLITTDGSNPAGAMLRGTGKKWNTVYEGEPIGVIQFKQMMQGPEGTSDAYAMRINGTILLEDPGVQHTDQSGTIVLPAADQTTLTFTDDTNLEYFKAGDLLVDGPLTGHNAQTYLADGTASQSFETGFSPDLVWIKNRDTTNVHSLFDPLRGPGKLLTTNSNAAQDDRGNTTLISFDESGFTVNNDGVTGTDGNSYAAWSWDAGAAAPTTDTWNGITLPTYYKANVSTGFSVCTYNGGGGNNSYGHGLGKAPDFVLVKRTGGAATDWATYHSGINGMKGGALSINTTGQFEAGNEIQWNSNLGFDNTACYLANNAAQTNQSGGSYVAYNWVETPGVSKFGSYTGQSGIPFSIECGFKPALVIIKRYNSSGGNWVMIYPSGQYVYANLTNGVADASTQEVVFTETGFTVKGSNADINSGGQHIYCAWSSQGVIGTVVEDADVANKSMLVSGGTWDTSNQSQAWSPQLTSSAGFNTSYPASMAFDGSINTYCQSTGAGNALTFTPTNPITYTNSVRTYNGTNMLSQINPGTGGSIGGSGGGWVTIVDGQSGTINEMTFGGNDVAQLHAIEIDGKILIDGAFEGEVWSTKVDTPEDPANPYSNIFDGDGGNSNPGGMPEQGTLLAEWKPDTPIVFTDKVVFKGSNGSVGGAGPVFVIDGVRTDYTNDNPGGATFEVEVTGGGTLESIEWGYPQTTIYTYWRCLIIDGKEVVDKGIRYLGETTAKTVKSGEGVVGSVNLELNTMTLSSTNGGFIDGFHVTTPEKNAVEMRGYLSFDSQGNNVDLQRLPQSPVLMDDVKTPKLNFPSTFSTGEGVDTDLPFPTYLETYVQASNDLGSSLRVKSNELFPDWTGRPYIAPGSYRVMQDEFADWCYWACSSDYRAAVKTIQDAEATVQELRTKAETMAQNFLNRDDVY